MQYPEQGISKYTPIGRGSIIINGKTILEYDTETQIDDMRDVKNYINSNTFTDYLNTNTKPNYWNPFKQTLIQRRDTLVAKINNELVPIYTSNTPIPKEDLENIAKYLCSGFRGLQDTIDKKIQTNVSPDKTLQLVETVYKNGKEQYEAFKKTEFENQNAEFENQNAEFEKKMHFGIQ